MATHFINGFISGFFRGIEGESPEASAPSDVDTRVVAAAAEALAGDHVPVGSRTHTYESSASEYVSRFGYEGPTNDPSADSSGPGVEHCDGHVSPPTSAGDFSAGDVHSLIKDVLQALLGERAGGVIRAVSDSPVTQTVVESALSGTADVAKDALSTIGESLTKDQP